MTAGLDNYTENDFIKILITYYVCFLDIIFTVITEVTFNVFGILIVFV